MSLRSDTQKRQSFSERICDDLCQVLIKYLSFEDKIRFECVSKQFQRLIFNKQYCIEIIEINPYLAQNRNCDRKENTLNALIKKRNQFNYKAFESVLKKCKFINNIIINYRNDYLNTKEVLKSIVKNCTNLKSIAFNFNRISDHLIENFGRKLGQNLREITFIEYKQSIIKKYKKLLRLSPNLVSFGDEFGIDLSLFVDKNELLVPKL
jgi:hypothetical protein